MRITELPSRWREDTALMRSYGATAQAEACERMAAQLETVIREEALQTLTLDEAANESGLSYSALQKMVAKGAIHNAGTHGSPRILRGDLPKKAIRASRSVAEVSLLKRAG